MMGANMLHCLRYFLGLDPAHTQTTGREQAVIQRWAQGRRRLVEIGVFEGFTSRLIRAAMAPDGVLWCIDPFTRGRLGLSYGLAIAQAELRRTTNGTASIVRQYSHEAVCGWKETLDYVFIDGDHAYEGVRRDWKQWSPFVSAGGVVLFHDSNQTLGGHVEAHHGPCRVVQEIRDCGGSFAVVEVCDSLTVVQRQ